MAGHSGRPRRMTGADVSQPATQTQETFVDVECAQERKHGENAFGDCFLSRRLPQEDRVIAVLSDGMGSGIKANILSTMTAHMALRFIASDTDLVSAVQTMMDALPVCRIRKISYATFTIVDYRAGGGVRLIELDNPFLVRMRGEAFEPFARREMKSAAWGGRSVYVSEFDAAAGDRLIFVSDGVVQAGMGSAQHPLGWGEREFEDFVEETICRHPGISAYTLSTGIVSAAIGREPAQQARDDVSCAVMHFREPRRALVLSGPPAQPEADAPLARRLLAFGGKRVICGGTTCRIISRETGVEAVTDRGSAVEGVPPSASMPGVDLVTEGIVTLNRTAELLESREANGRSAAARLARLLRESDDIVFVVGTRENTANFGAAGGTNGEGTEIPDPLAQAGSIELRRNVIRRMATVLEQQYLKRVRIEYI